MTVTFTLTVFVAVTVGAGFAFAVAVAVTVTVGPGLAAAGFASSVLVASPLAPAPMPRKNAKPSAGRTYLLRAHLGVGCGGCCGLGGHMYGLLISSPTGDSGGHDGTAGQEMCPLSEGVVTFL
ncbi:hypothetical protein ACIBAG_28255 [Streptomyces sp. NPDC051243]|uniref:hypothetical protein n=1 Tax=Streptomyces sp. NPDC051243 TaxID=3365646 RepID=UPI0037B10F09